MKRNFIDSIKQSGLISKSRLYVHLSKDLDTATKVGSRHGNVVVLKINEKQMHIDGYKFYLSENRVLLSDTVPIKYLSF